jgi:hypothetical protein
VDSGDKALLQRLLVEASAKDIDFEHTEVLRGAVCDAIKTDQRCEPL